MDTQMKTESGSKAGTNYIRTVLCREMHERNGTKGTAEIMAIGAEINLPWPPSVNTYYRTFRGRVIISKEGRDYRKKVKAPERTEPVFSEPVTVEITAYRPDNRKRDLDNVLKVALDTLTHMLMWKDDSQIQDLRIRWAIEKGGFLNVKVRPL